MVESGAEVSVLDNGILRAEIENRTGVLQSLRYQGVEMLATKQRGADGGYWSAVGRTRPAGPMRALVRIDPRQDAGARGEIACQFRNPAGSPTSPLDFDYRYALGRGDQFLSVYAVLRHPAGNPSFGVGEARYCIKLNPAVFDYLAIDEARHMRLPSGQEWDEAAPLNVKEARRIRSGPAQGKAEHKYSYSAVMSEVPAYGWASTTRNLGLWIINPSLEYISGGPTKAELTGHLDVNPGGLPTLLNMWVGSHYGGSSLFVPSDLSWEKVVGPFLLYCNTNAAGPVALWREALDQAAAQSRQWPYAWLDEPAYPQAVARGSVQGRLTLRDPQAPNAALTNGWIGLTAPDYSPFAGSTNQWGRGRVPGRGGFPALVDWQRDARYYQYWARLQPDGRFTIPHARPGTYMLRAIAENVLGELTLTNIVVNPGHTNQLGELPWTPLRYGRTLWEIGIPDRTAREFRHGDDYWHWGTYFLYPREFPRDVRFVIGQSDWRRDWNYVQPPRLLKPIDRDSTQPFNSELLQRDNVRSTAWEIVFNQPAAAAGRAWLRVAFCGSHMGCRVEVFINGKSIGDTGELPSTSAMQREGVRAYWVERALSFDARLLQRGNNTVRLLSHADSWSQGVNYDYLRMELE